MFRTLKYLCLATFFLITISSSAHAFSVTLETQLNPTMPGIAPISISTSVGEDPFDIFIFAYDATFPYAVTSFGFDVDVLEGGYSNIDYFATINESFRDVSDDDTFVAGISKLLAVPGQPNLLLATLTFTPTTAGIFSLKVSSDDIMKEGVFTIFNRYELLNDTITVNIAPAPAPEPATMLLFAVGLLGLAGTSRRRNNVQ